MRPAVLATCLVLTLGLLGCEGSDNHIVEVQFSSSAMSLAPGESEVLQVTVVCTFQPCDAVLGLVEPTLPAGLRVEGLGDPPQSVEEGRARVWTLTVTSTPEAPAFEGGIAFSARPADGGTYESRQVEVVDRSLSLIVTGPPGTAPVARFAYTPATPTVGQPIAFDAGSSSGAITRWRWDFGADGSVEATGPSATYSFGVAGAWAVRLQVADGAGQTNELTRIVEVVGGGSSGEAVLTLSFTGAGGGGVTFLPAVTACSRDSEPVCARRFPALSTVVLKGFAYTGARLGGWGPGCSSVNPDGDECTVVMDGDRQISLRID